MLVEAGNGCALGAARLMLLVTAGKAVCLALFLSRFYHIDIMVISYRRNVNRVC